jgi:acyl-CoA reductase-like NAD-dependent aldehyde dehydrogenase
VSALHQEEGVADAPSRVAHVVAGVPTGLIIGGRRRAASDGATFDVLDPATGNSLAAVASGTVEDAIACVDAGAAAAAGCTTVLKPASETPLTALAVAALMEEAGVPVLTGVAADAESSQTEIFGPVAPIVTFSTEEEAVALADNTEYGLVSYVYTGDLARGLRVAERIEAGMVGLNRGLVSDRSRRAVRRCQGKRSRPRRRRRGTAGLHQSKYVAVDW